MTDGNTAVQVSPITEEEMSKVHSILRRAADAIVGMSQLKVDVDNLSAQLRQLTDDCERLRRTNDALEESLSQSRRQRQGLEQDLATVGEQLVEANKAKAEYQSRADLAESRVKALLDNLDKAAKERDEAIADFMRTDDELTKAKAIFDKLRDAFGALPAPAVQPTPPPSVGEVVQSAQTPTNSPKVKRVYTRNWSPGCMWDNETGQYYTEVPDHSDDEMPF